MATKKKRRVGEPCYVPVSTNGTLWDGEEREALAGFVRCTVRGTTDDWPLCYDLEDAREAPSPAGLAPWEYVPPHLMYTRVPDGEKELVA